MTNSRTILHIGTHKTGTTFLQNVLQSNPDVLRAYGICYPEQGRDLNPRRRSPGHRYFPAFFRDQGGSFPTDFNGRLPEGDALLPIQIISAEAFWYCSRPDIVERIRKHFSGELTIICYVRSPDSHLYSLYANYLSKRVTSSFADFVEQQRLDLESPRSFAFYAYDANLATWQTVFSDVRLVCYQRVRNNVDFMAQFFNTVGINVDCTKLTYDDVFGNPSPSPIARLLVQQANTLLKEGVMSPRQQKLVRRYLENNDSQVETHFADCVASDTVDLRPFLETFARHNPTTMALLGSGTQWTNSVVLPTHITITPQALLHRFMKVLESQS